ncbi:hypothetical protein GOP47_0002132 [Adiantum capillus-veneris]|uniref:Uncharacterized protein n=1 Tax=Adiantum capillus-veneris TaxID=13818 RepID=A0A9D4ZNX0_ADICA|nr:hypothetical protein GOP47_0002132 [Adiantum capillus-veneris]
MDFDLLRSLLHYSRMQIRTLIADDDVTESGSSHTNIHVKDSTLLMVDVTESGSLRMDFDLLWSLLRYSRMQIRTLMEKLSPVASFHYLNNKEITATNLVLCTLPFLDRMLTRVIQHTYGVSQEDSGNGQAIKIGNLSYFHRYFSNGFYRYLALLDAPITEEICFVLRTTEIFFLQERYMCTTEEANELHMQTIRYPLIAFKVLKESRDICCHLFDKVTLRAKHAQRAVLVDLQKAIVEGCFNGTVTDQLSPFLILETQRRINDIGSLM